MIIQSGHLYIVATPIGNLEDVSQRAITVLKKVDLIAAEDTRHSAKLLAHYGIQTTMISLHEHNEKVRCDRILQKILEGVSVALISDSGTPLISDPGYRLVHEAREHRITVIPIPGPCAAICALSAAGLPSDRFVFEGFLPSKKEARLKRLEKLEQEMRTMIFYEAPHRIIALLKDMVQIFGGDRHAVIARELTKRYETIHGSALHAVLDWLEARTEQHCGEFVVLVSGKNKPIKGTLSEEDTRILKVLLKELSTKQAASLAAKITGKKKALLYQRAVESAHRS